MKRAVTAHQDTRGSTSLAVGTVSLFIGLETPLWTTEAGRMSAVHTKLVPAFNMVLVLV